MCNWLDVAAFKRILTFERQNGREISAKRSARASSQNQQTVTLRSERKSQRITQCGRYVSPVIIWLYKQRTTWVDSLMSYSAVFIKIRGHDQRTSRDVIKFQHNSNWLKKVQQQRSKHIARRLSYSYTQCWCDNWQTKQRRLDYLSFTVDIQQTDDVTRGCWYMLRLTIQQSLALSNHIV